VERGETKKTTKKPPDLGLSFYPGGVALRLGGAGRRCRMSRHSKGRGFKNVGHLKSRH